MTIEEAVKVIESEHVWLPRTYGWRKVEDAHEMAIKALENQPKYEKALAMACELVPKSDWCYTKEHVCDKRGCTMCMIAYFKKKAGIEVDNE
jgi:hypothetical protein